MIYQIRDRWTGELIFEKIADSFKTTVELAVRAKINLDSANLNYADLRHGNMIFGKFRYATFVHSDLRYTDFRGSNFENADLRFSDMRYTNFRHTDLSGANLSGSEVDGAELGSAEMRRTDIRAVSLIHARGLRDYMMIGPIGSHRDMISAAVDEKDGIRIWHQSFSGNLSGFKKHCLRAYSKRRSMADYVDAIELIRKRFGSNN